MPVCVRMKETSKFPLMQVGYTPNSFPACRVKSSQVAEDFNPCGLSSDDVKEGSKFNDYFAVDDEYKSALVKFSNDLKNCNKLIFLSTSGGYQKDLKIASIGGVFRDMNGNIIGLPFHGRVDAPGFFEAQLLATQFGLEVASHVPINLSIIVNMAGGEAVKMINMSHYTDPKFFEAYTRKSDKAHRSNVRIGFLRTILDIVEIRFVPAKTNRLAHHLSTLAARRDDGKIYFLEEPYSHGMSEVYKLDKKRGNHSYDYPPGENSPFCLQL